MSSPEIALHKNNVMKEEEKNVYQKRTQKDYSMSFKLQIVQSIERGELTAYDARKQYGIQGDSTVLKWLRKFGNFDWQTQIPSKMAKTPAQRLMELEQEVLLLKKQKALLEKQIEFSDKKAIIFDIMIDLAEKEYNIPIRKNSSPEQLIPLNKTNKKA